MRHLVLLGALTLSVATVVSACGGDPETAAPGTTPGTADSALPAAEASDAGSASADVDDGDVNDADVTFAQEMVEHHRQASQMAGLASDRAAEQQVRDLATGIRAAQEPEIGTMTGWLVTWGQAVGADTSEMAGMDHGGTAMDEMPGMMSDEEMAALESATGPEFDQMFLTMMIEHHEGAIEMAEVEQRRGRNPDAVALAGTIAAEQGREIQRMRDLLGS